MNSDLIMLFRTQIYLMHAKFTTFDLINYDSSYVFSVHVYHFHLSPLEREYVCRCVCMCCSYEWEKTSSSPSSSVLSFYSDFLSIWIMLFKIAIISTSSQISLQEEISDITLERKRSFQKSKLVILSYSRVHNRMHNYWTWILT